MPPGAVRLVIGLLLDKGANTKVKKADGKTAFDLVEESKHLRNTEAYELLQKRFFHGSYSKRINKVLVHFSHCPDRL